MKSDMDALLFLFGLFNGLVLYLLPFAWFDKMIVGFALALGICFGAIPIVLMLR